MPVMMSHLAMKRRSLSWVGQDSGPGSLVNGRAIERTIASAWVPYLGAISRMLGSITDPDLRPQPHK